jgi:sec-independent protein translocase protein TatA
MSTLFAIMGISPVELMVLCVVLLLLFGNRLPSVMRSLGRGVVEFKRGINSTDDEVKAVERDDDRA